MQAPAGRGATIGFIPCCEKNREQIKLLQLDRCEIRVRVSFGAAAERNAGGQLREARNFPESLLYKNPENPDFLCNLGLCYVDLGQLDRGRGAPEPLPADRA